MKLFWRAGLFLCLSISVLMMPSALKRLTHSFHASRLHLNIPDGCRGAISQISIDEVCQILSQDFVYLGRGSQSFAFASDDGSYVLKLFIFDSMDSFSHRLFEKSFDSGMIQQKAIHTFDACKLACQFLPQETGVLFVHFNTQKKSLPTVRLIGPAWKRQEIHPEEFCFVLQKRALGLDEVLMQACLLSDKDRFFSMVDQLNRLLTRRIDCGIANTDPTLFENFGVIDGQVAEIDFGNYVFCPEIFTKSRSEYEKTRYTDQLLKWVERTIPQWKDSVAVRLKENQ